FIRNTDNLLIGRFMGSAALGFYSLGYAVFLTPINDIGVIVNRVMLSALSRLQDDSDRLKRAFLLATQYVTLMALPMLVGIALVAVPFVETVFGPQWLPAAPVISILALAGFFQIMLTVGPSGLQAAGHPELQLRWYILSTLLYIPAFAIGLRWGIVGVASGYLAATCVLTPIQFGFVARVTGVTFREMWEAIHPSVIGSAVMAVSVASVSWMLAAAEVPKIAMLVLLVLLGAVVYVGIVWVVRRQTLLDLVQILRQVVPVAAGGTLKKAGEG
ncbi:MAG: oligosaccharide flippase family protein, partial [bacterium]